MTKPDLLTVKLDGHGTLVIHGSQELTERDSESRIARTVGS